MFKAKQKRVSLLVACLTMLLTMLFGFATLFTPTPVTTASAATATVTDTLTVGITGATDTKYVTWSGKDGGDSDAIYAGNSSKSSAGAIQMRSSGSTSGIVTTTSAGKARKVVVVWQSATTSGRTLDIYGKNSAYTQASELYSSSTQGTKIGSIKYGTSTELTISSDYAYIGMRSNSGAMYLTSISITWEVELADGECAHENETEEITTPATCTTDGEKTFTCTDCGNTRTEVIEATGHDTTEEITTAATCTTAGEKTITCNNCDYEATEVIPALGHDYVDGACSVCGAKEPVEQTLTLTFDNTTKRTSFSTTQQVWEENGITFTNNKSSSGTNVADFANPVRLYANSQIVIACANMIKIEFTCSSASYATALKNSIGDTATVDGSVVTVKFTKKTNSYEVASLTAQIRMDSITVYTNACAHENQTTTTVDATCTTAGSITVTCDDCGETVSTEEIPATGHNYASVVTPPTTTEEGYTTYTCQDCGDSYQNDFKPALGETQYTISFSVPNGINMVKDMQGAMNYTIKLPSAQSTAIYTFVGWATEKTTEQNTCPEIFEATSEYEVTGNITLYAVYSYMSDAMVEKSYVKVTENLTDWSGKYLIVYEDGTKAYVFNATDAVNGYIPATITDSVIEYTAELDAEAVTIAPMTDGYSILTSSGYSYGVDGSNALKFDTSTAQLNTIAFTANGVDITSNTSILRFNSASNQMRFRYYKSGQQAIQLYKYTETLPILYATPDSVTAINTASVTLGDDLKMNYYVSNSNAEAVMYFTVNGNTYDVAGVLQPDGRYSYTLTDIPPQCMTDEIKVELKSGENVLDAMENYSIQQYAQNMLNKNPSEKLKQLLTDMLYYGAAAQTYRNYNTGKLATEGVENLGTPSNVELPEVSAIPVSNPEIDSYPVFFTSANVWFGDVNKIIVKVNTTENAFISVNDGEKVALTSTTFETEGLYATQLDKEFVFKLYQGDTLMQTLTYSVNAYAYKMQSYTGENADAMKALALALYRYGVSAKAYAGL